MRPIKESRDSLAGGVSIPLKAPERLRFRVSCAVLHGEHYCEKNSIVYRVQSTDRRLVVEMKEMLIYRGVFAIAKLRRDGW